MKDDATLHDARLQDLARRLGAQAAEQLDVERTAQAVVARLRAEPRTHGRPWVWMQPVWLRIAAAVVLLVGAGVVVRAVRGPAPPHGAALVEPAGAELSDLSTAQLEQVLQEIAGGGRAGDEETPAPQDVSLDDLSAPQLRALLASLET